ncbi:MAG: hypothetical protein H7070_14150 [Saprospiraceae bacterium]|nr:hypothetical protein [Pyrinomonadaceae bacterium]
MIQRSRNGRSFYFALPVVLIFIFSTSSILSQEIPPDDIAPPPIKQLSKTEKSQLDAEDEVKKRTKLALDLMDLRLKKAEELHSRQEFPEMFLELGGFHGLMDNTLEFLNRSVRSEGGKVLNNFKRLEIGLRMFTPRLEIIRRDLPQRFEFYPRNLIKYLRDARSKAIEPFFGNTVIPNRKT